MASETASEEDTTKVCDPCNFQGKHRDAVTYCVECSENLCYECERVHGSLKVTRDHTLEPFQDRVKAKPIYPTIMYCVNHETEVLSKFCKDHGNTICDLCFLTTHRKCNVQVLNDIAKEEGVNNEIAEFISNIKQTISSFEEIKKSREQDKDKIKQCSKSVREDVERIKSDILSWVEQLEHKTEEELCAKEEFLMGEIDNHIKVCDQVVKQLNLVLASIEKLDVGDQNIRFTILVKNKASVEDGGKMKEEISAEITPVDFKLYRSDQLIKSMAKICNMGNIQGVELPKVDINFLDISSAEKVKQPEVFNGWVTGCAIMPDGKIVICEGEKEEFVKVLTPNFEIRNEILMKSNIWDVAAIGPDEVVVTGAYSKKLFFFDISKGIKIKRSIELDIPCFGVVYEGTNIFVSCGNDEADKGKQIRILTVDGTYVSSFNTTQGFPYFLAVNSDLSRISTSTYNKSSVQTFDRDGTLINTYTDSQLKCSLGILIDRADNTVVCGYNSKNIHVVKKDGTKHKILSTSLGFYGLSSPYCLGYRQSDKTLIVGLRESPFLLVFRMK